MDLLKQPRVKEYEGKINNIPKTKENVIWLGKSKCYSLNNHELTIFREEQIDVSEIDCYNRLEISGEIYSTSSYCERFQSNDSIILMKNNKFAKVIYFFKLDQQEYFLAEILEIDERNILHKMCHQMNAVKSTTLPKLQINKVINIQEKCFIVSFQGTEFVIKFPNSFEND